MRQIAALGVVTLALAGCGDSGLLEGLGERSHEYVQGSTTIAESGNGVGVGPPVSTTLAGAVPVESVGWFNEGIEGEVSGEPNIVIATVWNRGDDEGRFIQASPAEIAAALPGVEFPTVAPVGSTWVTSQLVFDAASATLDIDISAAFGLWAVEPYTEGEGRLAVLRVGQAIPGEEVGTGVVSAAVEEGLSLSWSDASYRYELFCSTEVLEDQCWHMVESMLPLEVVAPASAQPAGAEGAEEPVEQADE